jgi:hypothetical protein
MNRRAAIAMVVLVINALSKLFSDWHTFFGGIIVVGAHHPPQMSTLLISFPLNQHAPSNARDRRSESKNLGGRK